MSKYYYDLHTHSCLSPCADNGNTPCDLLGMASISGINILALTDHNTSSGLPIFMKEAEAAGVTAVAGVELSTNYQGKEFHLLGLFLEPQHYEAVESLCVEYQILKEFSNLELVEKLNNLGYHIEYPNVRRRNVKGNANRAHVAEELVACGYVGSVTEAFRTLLDEDLGMVEEDLYCDEDDEEDFDDDDFDDEDFDEDDDDECVSVECPSCGEEVFVDETMDFDNINCPSCGAKFSCSCSSDCGSCGGCEN